MPDSRPIFARAAELVSHITACQSALYGYVCALLGSSAGAADVLQETNLALWEKAHEYDFDRPFLPWAYRFAYLQVLAHRKRRSREKMVFDDELLGRVAEAFERRCCEPDRRLELLDGCVGKLAPHHKELVDRKYRRGESVNAIAGELNTEPNTIAAKLYRIRKLLMDCIESRLAAGGES